MFWWVPNAFQIQCQSEDSGNNRRRCRNHLPFGDFLLIIIIIFFFTYFLLKGFQFRQIYLSQLLSGTSETETLVGKYYCVIIIEVTLYFTCFCLIGTDYYTLFHGFSRTSV